MVIFSSKKHSRKLTFHVKITTNLLYYRSLPGPPRPPRAQSQVNMVSQNSDLTPNKTLPRSSSEPKVDKHMKREIRAAKSRSVHFDGSGPSNSNGIGNATVICCLLHISITSRKNISIQNQKKYTKFIIRFSLQYTRNFSLLLEPEELLKPISIIGNNSNAIPKHQSHDNCISNGNGVLETDLDLPPPPPSGTVF